jgi:putative flippase GtrA
MDDQENKARKIELFKQFLRFNAMGIINTLVTYVLFSALVFAGLSHFVALLFDYACGICLGYVLNKKITFAVRDNEVDRWMFGRMVLAYLPSLALNAALLWLLADVLGWNAYAAQALSLSVVAIVSFAAQRLFVFRRRRSSANG